MQNESTLKKINFDKVGIFCSIGCFAHCLIAPIVAIFSPVIAHQFESEFLHIGLFVLIVPVAFMAFFQQYRLHKQVKPIIIGAIGTLLLTIGLLAEEMLTNEMIALLINSIGGLTLASAHYLNLRITKACLP